MSDEPDTFAKFIRSLTWRDYLLIACFVLLALWTGLIVAGHSVCPADTNPSQVSAA